MKKHNLTAMALSLLLLAGCAAKPKTFEEMTVAERIEAATDYSGITACFADIGKTASQYTEEDRDALFEKAKTFLFTEGNINGTYYYNEQFLPGTIAVQWYGSEVSYTIVLYSVSGDEIYLVPAEDAPEDVQDIPNMSNAAEYRYQAVRDEDWASKVGYYSKEHDEYYFDFDLQRSSDKYEVSVSYYYKSKLLHIGDNLPQQLDAEGEKTMPVIQDYYADEATSLSVSQAEYDEMAAEKEAKKEAAEKLAKSEPQIGMTKAEVESCAWGSPNKKNVDTYAWGTTEQWVYNSKGYVYFRNGVVSSVSKR